MRPFAPETSADLVEWLRERRSERAEAEPCVSTGTDRGALPDGLEPGPRDLVSLSRIADVEDFRPSDLTITVGAGMRVGFLQRLVREQGLWLAASEADHGRSVAGWVAAAPAHSLEDTFGPVRRQVLACTLVLHDGRVTKWGRAVMKNVAGYDVPRLACGSRGRLGTLTSLTLRLWPAPRVVQRIRVAGDRPAVVGDMLSGVPDLGGLEWRERAGDARFTIDGLLTGGVEAVAARRRSIDEWTGAQGLVIEELDVASDSAALHYRHARARPATSAVYRMSFGRRYLSTGLAEIRKRLGPLDGSYALIAYPGSGVVRIEAEELLPANRRAAPAWLTALVGTGVAGRARSDRLERGPTLRVERGGPEEHVAARHLRSAAARALESRILSAFDGRDAPWQAEYL